MSTPDQGDFTLKGVMSWVLNIDLTRGTNPQRIWMDLDGDLETFGGDGELKLRMYLEAYGIEPGQG